MNFTKKEIAAADEAKTALLLRTRSSYDLSQDDRIDAAGTLIDEDKAKKLLTPDNEDEKQENKTDDGSVIYMDKKILLRRYRLQQSYNLALERDEANVMKNRVAEEGKTAMFARTQIDILISGYFPTDPKNYDDNKQPEMDDDTKKELDKLN